MNKPDYKGLVDQIRKWLLAGATIKARSDYDGKILEAQEDGSWKGGLIITFPDVETKEKFSSTLHSFPRGEDERP